MMVNIRETAIPISLTSALIPKSQRPGALRLVSLCRLSQESTKVIFHSHIASHDKILSCYYFFFTCVSRDRKVSTLTHAVIWWRFPCKKTNKHTDTFNQWVVVAV